MTEVRLVANIRGPIGLSYRPRAGAGGKLIFDTYQKDVLIAENSVIVDLPPGPTPDITMKAKGIAFGLQPTVVKSGTALAPVFELGVPAGATGPAPKLQPGNLTVVPFGSTPTFAFRELSPGTYAVDLGTVQGPKGDKGDTGSSSTTIVDGAPSTTTTWPSSRIALEARGQNLIPNGLGEWGGLGARFQAPLIYETTDKPAELAACYRTVPGQGTITASGANVLVPIDPSIQYRFTFWCKADVAGSRIVIECRDQDNAHAVESGTLGSVATNYLVFGLEPSTTWTKYERLIRFKPTTKHFFVGGLYFNHPTGATTQNAAQSIAMSLVPVGPVAAHTHAASEITGVLPASQVPTIDKLQGQLLPSQINGKLGGSQVYNASQAAVGVVQLATQSQLRQGTGGAYAVSPSVTSDYRHWSMTDAQRLALTAAELGTRPLYIRAEDTGVEWMWTGTRWLIHYRRIEVPWSATYLVATRWVYELSQTRGLCTLHVSVESNPTASTTVTATDTTWIRTMSGEELTLCKPAVNAEAPVTVRKRYQALRAPGHLTVQASDGGVGFIPDVSTPAAYLQSQQATQFYISGSITYPITA